MRSLTLLTLMIAFQVGCSGKSESTAVAKNNDAIKSKSGSTPPTKPAAPLPTRKEMAVAAIRRLGGVVLADENVPGHPIVEVTMFGNDVTDDTLVNFKELTQLRALDLICPKVSDSGLVHLKGLTELRKLSLNPSSVTDAGLVNLKELTNLVTLKLGSAKLTDAGMIHLKTLTKLEFLSLNNTRVTATGVKMLQAALPNCTIVR